MMKKYEAYKDSGLEWLGMVPEHWEIDKLKYQFGLVTAPSESSNKIGLENIESATGRFIKTDSDFEGNGIAFLPNDIVYGKLRPYLQKVWLAEFSGSAVGDFYVFRCNEGTYSVYVKYLLLSHNFTVEADGSTYGAKMPRVSYEFVANLKWAMPPLSEQRTIASYLDHKVGQIDALISEKEKMVEDLKAYSSSLITETVTKGLNKKVEMKDSGLEWLGMVPEHWEIDKLKYQFGLVTAPSESSNKIGLENIESATGRFIKTDSDFEGNGIAFLPNDIVYGKLRPYLKKVWLAEFSGSAVGDFYVFRCNEGTYPVYVKYLLLSHNFTVEADGSTYGAKMPRVSYEFVANLKWAMPPLSEQRTIASYLDHKVDQIDTSISEIEHQLSDLKSYKSSLITEAVTGKIDLRDWQTKKS